MLDIQTNFAELSQELEQEADLLLSPNALQNRLQVAGKRAIANTRLAILRRLDAYGEPFIIKRNPTPLIRSGALLNAFYAMANGPSLIVGNRMPYSDQHNMGLGVPRRTFLDAESLADNIASQLLSD